MRDELEYLVNIETWHNDIFEFAHFTDEELAQALSKAYTGSRVLKVDYLVEKVAQQRSQTTNKNIERILRDWNHKSKNHNINYIPGRRVGKIAIAKELWPILERKILDAKSEDELNRIPIVNVLLKAERLAAMTHRKDVVIRY